MKKIINFRPLFLSAIVMLVAIFLATRFFVAQSLKLTAFIVLLVSGILCLICFSKIKKRVIAVVGAMLLIASYPFLNIFIKGEVVSKYQSFNNETVSVSGTIKGPVKMLDNGSVRVLVDDAKVVYFSENYKISGGLYLYFTPDNYNLEDFRSGTSVNVVGKIKTYSYQDEDISKSLSHLSVNIVGYISGRNTVIKTGEYNPSLADKVRVFIENKLGCLDDDYAGVAYALLFGDTNHIDAELKGSFQDTGIAHLLAVSGLHVSVIVAFISFVMRKCKAKMSTNLITTGVLLLLYCYLCGFSVSVVRAAIMAMIVGCAMFRGKAKDGLSSLSLACLITTIINPSTIYSVAFQLSYISVFSIFCLAPPLSRLLNNYFYSKFANTAAITTAVCIGVSLVSLCYFEALPILNIPINMLLIPIASVAFVLLVLGVVIATILPFASVVMLGYQSVMSVVIKFNVWVSALDLSVFATTGVLSVVLMLVVTFILSDYLFVSNKTKRIVSLCGLAMILLMLIFV